MKNIELIKGFWLEDLNTIKSLPTIDLKDYLKSSKYLFEYNTDSTSGDAIINLFQFNDVLSCVICDFLKFSRVSFQSIEKIPKTIDDKNISWAIVKSYYSSFFAAQGLMRLSGYYFAHLDREIIQNINANSPNRPRDLVSGIYMMNIDEDLETITLKSLVGKKTTHQGLWEQFIKYAKDLDTFVLNEYNSGASDFRNQLDKLLTILHRENDGSFLTSFRNDINYVNNHKYWNSLQTIGVKMLSGFDGKKGTWKNNSEKFDLLSKNDDELADFQQATGFLISLSKEAFLELDRITTENKKSLYKKLISNGYLGFDLE